MGPGGEGWGPAFPFGGTKQHSQSVSYFTVPPRAHPSTGSQSGSATPGLTQVPSTHSLPGATQLSPGLRYVNR